MSTPSAQSAGGGRLTREAIIERIRRWHELYGEPPVTADWNPSVARWRAQEWRVPRYQAGDPLDGRRWPSLNAVKRRFGGSFDAAVIEAGFEPRRPGPAPSRRPAPSPPPSVVANEVGTRLRDDLRAAEERARAAEERERAAREDAERARDAARQALDGSAALSSAELGRLRREASAAGPGVLGSALQDLARARAGDDRDALRSALIDVAGAAVRWRDRL